MENLFPCLELQQDVHPSRELPQYALNVNAFWGGEKG